MFVPVFFCFSFPSCLPHVVLSVFLLVLFSLFVFSSFSKILLKFFLLRSSPMFEERGLKERSKGRETKKKKGYAIEKRGMYEGRGNIPGRTGRGDSRGQLQYVRVFYMSAWR